MSAAPLRRDRYGAPLPELALAEREALLHSDHNSAQLKFLHELIDHHARELLHRGTNARLILRVGIADGSMQDDVSIVVATQWRRRRA